MIHGDEYVMQNHTLIANNRNLQTLHNLND